MCSLGRFCGQRLVVEASRGVGIERQSELVVPAELEPGLAQRVVAVLRSWVLPGQVCCVGGDLVADDAGLDVVPVGQAQVFLRGDIAQHGRAGWAMIAAPMAEVMWS